MESAAAAANPAESRHLRQEVLRRLKNFRDRVDRHFPAGLCRDRNLEILLGLYDAFLVRAALTTRELAEMTGVDQGSALRRLYVLEQKGLVDRSLDLHDRRRTTICLSERGICSVEGFLDSWDLAGGPAGVASAPLGRA